MTTKTPIIDAVKITDAKNKILEGLNRLTALGVEVEADGGIRVGDSLIARNESGVWESMDLLASSAISWVSPGQTNWERAVELAAEDGIHGVLTKTWPCHSVTSAADFEDDGVDEIGTRHRVPTGYGRSWCTCGWVTSDADGNDWVRDYRDQKDAHLAAARIAEEGTQT